MALHEGGNYGEMISGLDDPTPQNTLIETPMPKKEWVHGHPYLATIVGVGGLLILGSILVIQRTDVVPSNSSGAWGGAGGMFFNGIRAATAYRPNIDIARYQSPQDSVAFIPIFTPSVQSEETDENTPADDSIIALLSLLVQSNQTSGPAGGGEEAPPDSYSFIPQGFVSAETPTKKRTPLQESLFSYGNQVGTYVKGYEDMHYGTAQILKDHIEDRANPQKITAVRNLGLDMRQLGFDLQTMSAVPQSVSAAHKSYAAAYKTAGANLVKIAETQTDEEFVGAITTYNASVEELSKRFVLLVALFGANEVTFSSSDQGNIFMFTSNLSLIQ